MKLLPDKNGKTTTIKDNYIDVSNLEEKTFAWAKNVKQKAEIYADSFAEIVQPSKGCKQIYQELVETNIWQEIMYIEAPEVASERKKTFQMQTNTRSWSDYWCTLGRAKKQILMIFYMIIAAFRLKYVRGLWEVADVIILKQENHSTMGNPTNPNHFYL